MSNSKSKSVKSIKLNIRQRRVFSEQFKREKVAQISAGEISILSLSKLWNVSMNSIYKWVYKYSPDHKKGTTMVVQKDSEATKLYELQQKIAELERAIGQKQMVIDYQDKLIEIASRELEIDIKKNFNPGL
ncbi:transposase [Dyadobacter frigoris]|uniref:transposase n=1 Tax=Dyadobacter frigoris TaxID=2576211 RepID=UPI001C708DEA|nr:transposase [Dyadobacter frigoris]